MIIEKLKYLIEEYEYIKFKISTDENISKATKDTMECIIDSEIVELDEKIAYIYYIDNRLDLNK